MQSIGILPIEFTELPLLNYLTKEIKREFILPVEHLPIPFDLQFALNDSRKQYNSTLILAKILEIPPGKYFKILGITSKDLYIPVLTFVFGEAQLNGKAATVSSHRLHNNFYGLPDDHELFKERLLKESVHELGHTFGLLHCANLECVMHPSTYVEEIDLKSSHFCSFCKTQMIRSMT